MRKVYYCAAVALTTLLFACSSTTNDVGSSSGTSGTSGDIPDGGADAADAAVPFPAVPAIGVTQIDRMGRPAINTAANNTFNGDDTAKGNAKDAYNANSDPSTWSQYLPAVESSLAILDSLDTVCGNQFGVPLTNPPDDPSRYATLGALLLDDRLWVNTGSTTCTTYLGVEAAATGAIPAAASDCGGRVPSYEVIKLTYNLVASGALQATTPLTDGTTQVTAKTQITAFPYFAAPPAQ